MANDGEDSPGLKRALAQVCAGLVEGLQLRLELLGLETQQEKRRLIGGVFLGLFASLCGGLALLFANLVIVVRFWDRRVEVMAILAGVYLLVAIVLALLARRQLASSGTPFAATTGQLRKDRDAIGSKS